MPKYNIELRTHDRIWDSFAVERHDQTALRVEIATFLGQLLHDHAAQIWADEEWRVDATDETGLILFVMHLFVTNSAASVPMHR